MEQDQIIEIVQSTVLDLQAHSVTMMQGFYQHLFVHDQEIASLFNVDHQIEDMGEQNFVAGIINYATILDNPVALKAAAARMAHKSTALGIRPKHYPIFSQCFLDTVADILSIPKSDPVITAWEEAYKSFADNIVRAQHRLSKALKSEYGHAGFAPYEVVKKIEESDHVTSFYLKPKTSRVDGIFKPGQHITVQISVGEKTLMQSYSLSDTPGTDYFRISVKARENLPDDHVSKHLHNHISAGHIIGVTPPCGIFTFDDQPETAHPLILISEDIGAAPLVSMLKTAISSNPDRPIYFLHTVLNSNEHSFRQEVDEIAIKNGSVQVHYRYSEPLPQDLEKGLCHSIGSFNMDSLKELLPPCEGRFFVCGSKAFVDTTLTNLKATGIADDRVSYAFWARVIA